MGVNRAAPSSARSATRFPHTRGGEPQGIDFPLLLERFPHTRGGEPEYTFTATAMELVFPTRVGVNRCSANLIRLLTGFPHTRGGEPELHGHLADVLRVFPTRVGVNRLLRR